MTDDARQPPLEAATDDGGTLRAERLRDGRVALSGPAGMVLLDGAGARALAGWLAPLVEEGWLDTVRAQADGPLRTADDLYGEDPDRARRLGAAMLLEMPPHLVRRALALLANAIGPASRERLVDALNRTGDRSDDLRLRRRLAEEGDSFAYAVAAAALWDAADPGSPNFRDPTAG